MYFINKMSGTNTTAVKAQSRMPDMFDELTSWEEINKQVEKRVEEASEKIEKIKVKDSGNKDDIVRIFRKQQRALQSEVQDDFDKVLEKLRKNMPTDDNEKAVYYTSHVVPLYASLLDSYKHETFKNYALTSLVENRGEAALEELIKDGIRNGIIKKPRKKKLSKKKRKIWVCNNARKYFNYVMGLMIMTLHKGIRNAMLQLRNFALISPTSEMFKTVKYIQLPMDFPVGTLVRFALGLTITATKIYIYVHPDYMGGEIAEEFRNSSNVNVNLCREYLVDLMGYEACDYAGTFLTFFKMISYIRYPEVTAILKTMFNYDTIFAVNDMINNNCPDGLDFNNQTTIGNKYLIGDSYYDSFVYDDEIILEDENTTPEEAGLVPYGVKIKDKPKTFRDVNVSRCVPVIRPKNYIFQAIRDKTLDRDVRMTYAWQAMKNIGKNTIRFGGKILREYPLYKELDIALGEQGKELITENAVDTAKFILQQSNNLGRIIADVSKNGVLYTAQVESNKAAAAAMYYTGGMLYNVSGLKDAKESFDKKVEEFTDDPTGYKQTYHDGKEYIEEKGEYMKERFKAALNFAKDKFKLPELKSGRKTAPKPDKMENYAGVVRDNSVATNDGVGNAAADAWSWFKDGLYGVPSPTPTPTPAPALPGQLGQLGFGSSEKCWWESDDF